MPSVRQVGSRSRRLVLPALAAGSCLALAGGPLSPSGPTAAQPAPPPVRVSMKDFAFHPAAITIKAGTTVTWTYDDVATDPAGCENPALQLPGSPVRCPGHTATAVAKGSDGKPVFDSPNLKGAGASYSFTFDKPGTFAYYCIYHGGTTATGKNNPVTNMNGTIVVQAAPTGASTSGGTAAPSSPSPPSTHVKGESLASRSSPALANTGGRAALGWGLLPLAGVLALARRRRA